MTLDEALEQLKALGNEKMRAHNTKFGAGDNQFGVKHGDIRVLAKNIKADHKLVGRTMNTTLSVLRRTIVPMKAEYKAIVKRDGDWWIGWIEEIAGVNSQGATRDELMNNLSSALGEALELNREFARSAAGDEFEEVTIST